MAFDVSTVDGSPVQDLRVPKKGDEDRWVTYVDELLGYLRGTKMGHEYHWREALLFLADEQWIRYVSSTQMFRRHNLEDWVPTPVTNYIQKIYDRLLDLLTAGDYHATARPASQKQDDIDRAKAGTRILRSLFLDLSTSDTFERAAAWGIVTGNMVLSAGWDQNAGQLVQLPQYDMSKTPASQEVAVDPVTGKTYPPEFAGMQSPDGSGGTLRKERQPMMNRNGQPIYDVDKSQKVDEKGNPVFSEMYEGQVYEREVNLFGYFPQPRANPEDVRYAIEVEALSVDDLATAWGAKATEGIMPEDVNLLGWGSYVTSQYGSVMMKQGAESQELVLVKHFRHQPSDKYPEGKYVITAGPKLLYEGPIDTLKTKNGKLPYEHCRYRIIPGELWGHGPMRTAIPLQKRINSIDSAIIHNRKTMIHPKWLIPNRSGVRTIEGKPAAHVRWEPQHLPRGVEPRPVPGVPLPPQVQQEREQTVNELEDLIGTLEVLTGRQPSGVETVGQHQLLLEQATKRFAPLIKRWRRTLTRHERHKMTIAKEYWDEARQVKVVGENNITELYYYRGADLGNTTDVFLEMESEALYSRAIAEQKIERALERGLLGDPRDPQVRAKVLEKMKIEGFHNEFSVDAERARRNIHKIVDLKDFNVRPLPFDVFPIHFKILTDHIKSAEFESYEEEVQGALFQFAQAYQMAMQQQAQQAQAAAQATKGAGQQTEEQVVQSGAFGNQAQASPTV